MTTMDKTNSRKEEGVWGSREITEIFNKITVNSGVFRSQKLERKGKIEN